MNLKDALQKINFRQPKYILPAILYLPVLFTGYFLIDMFHTEPAEIKSSTLQTTEFLNPLLPEPNVQEDLDGKYESMLRSYGKVDDYSAVDNIERQEEEEKQQYESKYTEEEVENIHNNDLHTKLLGNAKRAENIKNETPVSFPLTDRERLIQSQQREEALKEELEKALNTIRSENSTQNETENTIEVQERAVTAVSEDDKARNAIKHVKETSCFFTSIINDDAPQQNLIEAIIDENIKAQEGSRVRLRLLDDIEIDNNIIPKGTYLYAIMSGFGSQRVKGTIESVLFNDDIIKVSLSIYDTDGLEGLYVPSSAYRDTGKDISAGAIGSNLTLGQDNSSNLTQWGMQIAQNTYQKATGAISKAIRKNRANLKYGTFVYLVNKK